jgi:hypothetical protein
MRFLCYHARNSLYVMWSRFWKSSECCARYTSEAQTSFSHCIWVWWHSFVLCGLLLEQPWIYIFEVQSLPNNDQQIRCGNQYVLFHLDRKFICKQIYGFVLSIHKSIPKFLIYYYVCWFKSCVWIMRILGFVSVCLGTSRVTRWRCPRKRRKRVNRRASPRPKVGVKMRILFRVNIFL